MAKYVIGIDYGTLSGRAVLADVKDGRIVAEAAMDYPHGAMDRQIPCGIPLKDGWALAHPKDYLEVLYATIPEIMARSGVDARDVIAIGLDVTSATVLPVKADGTPLCMLKAFERTPHAYAKLWKHHGAQAQATRMAQLAKARGESWLDLYGGNVSSEWSLPKLLEVLEDAPDVYDAMDAWVEMCDWLVWQLTGTLVQSSCAAGYKRFYRKGEGHPPKDFFAALNPRFANVIEEKCGAPIEDIGRAAGSLTPHMAGKLGLEPGICVAVGMVDAHACVPAAGLTEAGQMLAIVGTSTCMMMVDEQLHRVPGISGAVKDGILPGLWGYEAGQSCVGDGFAWFEKHCVPEAYKKEASEKGLSVQQHLTELAKELAPGESGLLALDWLNGTRSILMDSDLTGLLIGLTTKTTPQEIYRALIEATAFGARLIAETFGEHGAPVRELYVTGGICHKNAMMMQIYADVLKLPIHVVSASQGGALGSAIIASAAAGSACGGHDSVGDAVRAMASPVGKVYTPDARCAEVYDELYAMYKTLHDLFGKDGCGVMKRLRAVKNAQSLRI